MNVKIVEESRKETFTSAKDRERRQQFQESILSVQEMDRLFERPRPLTPQAPAPPAPPPQPIRARTEFNFDEYFSSSSSSSSGTAAAAENYFTQTASSCDEPQRALFKSESRKNIYKPYMHVSSGAGEPYLQALHKSESKKSIYEPSHKYDDHGDEEQAEIFSSVSSSTNAKLLNNNRSSLTSSSSTSSRQDLNNDIIYSPQPNKSFRNTFIRDY